MTTAFEVTLTLEQNHLTEAFDAMVELRRKANGRVRVRGRVGATFYGSGK